MEKLHDFILNKHLALNISHGVQFTAEVLCKEQESFIDAFH